MLVVASNTTFASNRQVPPLHRRACLAVTVTTTELKQIPTPCPEALRPPAVIEADRAE